MLVQFYSGLPLHLVESTGVSVSKAARGGNHGRDYFVHLYLKKINQRVSAEVRAHDLEPVPQEMVLTQQSLFGWWREKLRH